MKYIMSDLHGHLDEFLVMLDKIEFKDTDVLYILGDVIDRGNQSIELIRYIMNHSNIIMLLGNHEYMMREWYLSCNKEMFNMWMGNGGQITYHQFTQLDMSERIKIIKWIMNLPVYQIVDEKYFLVHAAYHEQYRDLQLTENYMVWARSNFYEEMDLTNCPYTVIFGHTPTINISRSTKIWHSTKKICIDCGIFIANIGKLGCLRLDDMQEFYIDK